LPEAPGNLGQLLPAKEKQGDQQNEQEVLRCEDVGLDKVDPSHRPLSLCQTDSDDQPLDVSQDSRPFCVVRHDGGGARARLHPSATPPPSFWPGGLFSRPPVSVPPYGCAGSSRCARVPHSSPPSLAMAGGPYSLSREATPGQAGRPTAPRQTGL